MSRQLHGEETLLRNNGRWGARMSRCDEVCMSRPSYKPIIRQRHWKPNAPPRRSSWLTDPEALQTSPFAHAVRRSSGFSLSNCDSSSPASPTSGWTCGKGMVKFELDPIASAAPIADSAAASRQHTSSQARQLSRVRGEWARCRCRPRNLHISRNDVYPWCVLLVGNAHGSITVHYSGGLPPAQIRVRRS